MTSVPIVVLAVASALGSGLMAGFFLAFSICVMGALGRLPAEQGIAGTQSINVVVLNPWFFTAFFGTAAVCLILAILSLVNWSDPRAIYLLAGSLLYLAGNIFVTMAFNVPLNKALSAVDPNSAQGAEVWTRYLASWTTWNHVRTAASLAAAALFTIAVHVRA
jgi:uncharacterized membrane protein